MCSGEAIIIEMNLKWKCEFGIICPKDLIGMVKLKSVVKVVHCLPFRDIREVPKMDAWWSELFALGAGKEWRELS